jgi:zinc/manganese transport system permease protein
MPIATMLEYDFMRHAFLAGGGVAIVAGAVGFFLVLRNLTFAGHALSHVGFAGATGSVLLGISPLWGLLAFTLAAAIAMGLLGERLRGRDVAVGIILSLALGLGVLFLYLYTTHATQATAILFGNVLGVSLETVWSLLGLSVVGLSALAFISRPLLFAPWRLSCRSEGGLPAAPSSSSPSWRPVAEAAGSSACCSCLRLWSVLPPLLRPRRA